jgi:hypothetical protein
MNEVARWPGIFTEHPIRAVQGMDPLASFDPGMLKPDSMHRPGDGCV